MLSRFFLAAALACTFAACGGGSAGGDGPSTPSTPPPTPAPTPTPNPYAAGCGTPLPPHDKMYGFKVKVQSEPSPNRKWLTASPLIRDADYCRNVGIPGDTCATRYEDNPQRPFCDHYLVGMSLDGRPGPNWYEEVNGVRHKCGTPGQSGASPNCDTRDESQYNLNVRAPGKYLACGGTGSNGSCGVCIIEESAWGRVHNNPAGLCKVS